MNIEYRRMKIEYRVIFMKKVYLPIYYPAIFEKIFVSFNESLFQRHSGLKRLKKILTLSSTVNYEFWLLKKLQNSDVGSINHLYVSLTRGMDLRVEQGTGGIEQK